MLLRENSLVNSRFLDPDLIDNLWARVALRRINRPLDVTLIRFLAVLLVFNFGIMVIIPHNLTNSKLSRRAVLYYQLNY